MYTTHGTDYSVHRSLTGHNFVSSASSVSSGALSEILAVNIRLVTFLWRREEDFTFVFSRLESMMDFYLKLKMPISTGDDPSSS